MSLSTFPCPPTSINVFSLSLYLTRGVLPSPPSSIPMARMMVWHSKTGARPQSLIFPLQFFFSCSFWLPLVLSVSRLPPPLLTTIQFNLQRGLSGTAAGLPHHFFLSARGFAAVYSRSPVALSVLGPPSFPFSKAIYLFDNLFLSISFSFGCVLSSHILSDCLPSQWRLCDMCLHYILLFAPLITVPSTQP